MCVNLTLEQLNYRIEIFTHLKLCVLLQVGKITHICLILDQTFTHIDVYTHLIPNICDLIG